MAQILIIGGPEWCRANASDALAQNGHIIDAIESYREIEASTSRVRPDVVLLDIDVRDTDPFELIRSLRRGRNTSQAPVVVISEKHDVQSLDEAFRAGAVGYINAPFSPSDLEEKVEAALSGDTSEAEAASIKPPEILLKAYDRIAKGGRILGDVAEIFGGIATRDPRKMVSLAHRGPGWRPMMVERDIHPYGIDYTGHFVHYQPRLFLRAPEEELQAATKLVLKRNAPPYTTAIDREGFLIDASVYGIVPADGLRVEYLLALFNSRLMDYFLRRVRPLPSRAGVSSMLRSIDIEDIPFLLPKKSEQDAIATLVEEMEAVAMGQSEHAASERNKLQAALNRGIFEINGFGRKQVDRLSELNF